VLVGVNIILLVVTLSLVFYLVLRLASVGAATLATLVFVFVFAVGQYERCGNFNWICPYSHEMTHGVTLSLATIVLLHRYQVTGQKKMAAMAGTAVGCLFLTRCDIFLAAAISCTAAWAAIGWFRQSLRQMAAGLAVFVGGMCLPPLAAFSLLARYLDFDDALRGILGSWLYITNRQLTGNPYYRALRGTHDLPASLQGMLLGLGVCLLVQATVVGLAYFIRMQRTAAVQHWRWPQGVVFATTIFAAAWLVGPLWPGLLRPWPLFAGAVALHATWRLAKSDRSCDEQSQMDALILRLQFSLFSLALLARMLFNAQVFHYGFALAMPSTMVVIAAVWTWIPSRLAAWNRKRRWLWDPDIYRSSILGVIAAGVLFYLTLSHHWYRDKVIPIAEGRDRFFADDRGASLVAAGRQIAAVADADDTLVVLPEGVMLNYLLGVRNPTGHINFMPPEVIAFGEERMLATFAASPPKWVVFTQRDTEEYGFRGFGKDYGQRLFEWIGAEYQVVGIVEGPQAVSTVVIGCRKPRQSASEGDR
jgi:hypothetical protein